MRPRALLAAVLLWVVPAVAGAHQVVKVETLVRPDTVLVGQTVHLAWRVWLPRGSSASFPARPPDDSLAHWRAWTIATVETKGGAVEHRLDAEAQSFALGPVSVPGPPVKFRIPGEEERLGRFPTSQFVVGRTVPVDGPEPPLRGMKPLLPPPWWALVPWWWVAASLALAALVVLLVRWILLRRRARPVAAQPEVPEEAPEIVARRRLKALVARRLPEAGLTYEHGSELADILHRFAERRFESPRPGFTTRELVRHLAGHPGVDPADLATFGAILEACDLTKFARRPYDSDRAHAAERDAARLVDAWSHRAPAVAAGDAGAPPARAGAAS